MFRPYVLARAAFHCWTGREEETERQRQPQALVLMEPPFSRFSIMKSELGMASTVLHCHSAGAISRLSQPVGMSEPMHRKQKEN